MSHSQVERRYRNTIKFHLDILTTKLLILKKIRASSSDAEESSFTTKSPSKAFVIASAAKLIESLESENAESKQFIKALQEQIEGLQNLVRGGDCAIRHHLQADSIL
jgi:glutaredoxin 2